MWVIIYSGDVLELDVSSATLGWVSSRVVWNDGSRAAFWDILRCVWHILGHFECDIYSDILVIVITGVTRVIGGFNNGLYHSRTWFGELLGSFCGFMDILGVYSDAKW